MSARWRARLGLFYFFEFSSASLSFRGLLQGGEPLHVLLTFEDDDFQFSSAWFRHHHLLRIGEPLHVLLGGGDRVPFSKFLFFLVLTLGLRPQKTSHLPLLWGRWLLRLLQLHWYGLPHEEDDFKFSSSQPAATYPPYSGGRTWGCTTSSSSPQQLSTILRSQPGAGAATCPPPSGGQDTGCTTSSSSPQQVSTILRSPPRGGTATCPPPSGGQAWGCSTSSSSPQQSLFRGLLHRGEPLHVLLTFEDDDFEFSSAWFRHHHHLLHMGEPLHVLLGGGDRHGLI